MSDPNATLTTMKQKLVDALSKALPVVVALLAGAFAGRESGAPSRTHTLERGRSVTITVTGPATIGELPDGALVRSAWPLEVAPVGSSS